MRNDAGTTQVQIRPAVLEDTERIAVLAGQLGYPVTAEDMLRRLRELLAEPTLAVYVAAMGAGPVVGWVGVRISPTVTHDHLVEVIGLVVDEDWRGRGIGRLLLERVEAWARERGHQTLYLRTNVVRQRAHELYRRVGFRELKTSLVFCKDIGEERNDAAPDPAPADV